MFGSQRLDGLADLCIKSFPSKAESIDFDYTISFLEIYNETVRDLL